MPYDEEQKSDTLCTIYEIDGFRSLRGFKISLTPGINVLVGPNGSGKTNFIEFLDFIEGVMRNGASAAVSSLGGLSRAFSIESMKSKSPKLHAKIKSIAEINNSSVTGDVVYFDFTYEIELKFNRKLSTIYISKEMVHLKKLKNSPQLESRSIGSISIIRKNSLAEERPKVNISARL